MGLAADCLSRAGLRALAVAGLLGARTLAGRRVYSDHAQPMEIEELPALLVATPAERKDTAGLGAPQFSTVMTLAIMARVAGPSEQATEALLDQLIEQVQAAILCTPAVVEPIERFEFVETLSVVSAEGEQMIGEATIMFGCRVYQQYEPDAGEPLVLIHTTIPGADHGAPVTFDSHPPQ